MVMAIRAGRMMNGGGYRQGHPIEAAGDAFEVILQREDRKHQERDGERQHVDGIDGPLA
jgi:hypothetical protein